MQAGPRYRRRVLGTKALEKVLKHHDRFCKTHIFEGRGRCSCGRNQAIAELRVLQCRLQQAQAELERIGKEDAMSIITPKKKLNPRFALTPDEQAEAPVEMGLAKYLTRLLCERPEVSLKTLLMSRNVQANVGQALTNLEQRIGKKVCMQAESDCRKGERSVWVTIEAKK